MKKTLIITLIYVIVSYSMSMAQFNSRVNLVTPTIASGIENDSMYLNPAELLLNDQSLAWDLTYSAVNNRTGTRLFGHLTDFWGIGDFGLGFTIYGSDLPNNLVLVTEKKTCDDNPFRLCDSTDLKLIESGRKFHFTWAKKTRFLSIGLQYRLYYFENIKNDLMTESAHSFDAGIFVTPFEESYFGLAVRNMGNSELKDGNGDAIMKNGEKVEFAETYIATLGLTSKAQDLAIAAAIPLDLINKLKKDPNEGVKQVSIQITKIFENVFELSGGYDTRDWFIKLGVQFTPYSKFTVAAAKQAVDGEEMYMSCGLNLSLPLIWETKKTANSSQNELKKKQIESKPTKTSRRATYKNQTQRTEEEKLDAQIYQEIKDEIDDEIKTLEIKKKKLIKLKRKNEIEKELEELDN